MKTLAVILVLTTLISSSSAQCPASLPGCFGCRPGATRITCTNAGLTSFPVFPPDLQQSVETLNLRSNMISTLTGTDVQNYTSLTNLDISFNDLMSIDPDSFASTPNLEEIDLSGNLLTGLPDNLFESTSLRLLQLSQNNIGNISAGTFNGLQQFPTINLQDNVLRRILNGTFSEIGTIEELNLDGNPLLCDCDLRWLPGYLVQSPPLIPNVGACDAPMGLRGTAISTLNEGDLVCDLSGNLLTGLPDNLFESTSLRLLQLSQNNIGNISAGTFNGLQQFPTINLQDNVLRRILNGTFSEIGTIEELNLDGNPLLCDCDLRWLPGYLVQSPPLIPNVGACDAPMGLRGTAISTLNEGDLVCDCSPMCVNGTCDMSVGECQCNDGYIGNDCSIGCPIGTYGAGCLSTCNCVPEQESSPCDPVDGTCHCRPGYTGDSCEQECPEGFYGQDCLDVCLCQNGADCDFISGFCNCTIGFMGMFCDIICPPLLYGLGCSQACSCTTGNCHHITGECACPIGFFGTNCSHNCTEVPDCASVGREECSLTTPEQTCGQCLQGYVGETGIGNSECILCSGAPDCAGLNRQPCSQVVNTCGPCFQRHLGESGYSNLPCFDPCIDGIMNYDETDIDCGGSLCPSCLLGDVCTLSLDCGDRSVCLGEYIHPSGLEYPFDLRDNNTCVEDTTPGLSLLERFKAALQGREAPLSNASPFSDRPALEQEVQQEIEIQFNVDQPLESIKITELEQAPGDPLYQTNVELQGTDSQATESFSRMIENIHNGKLKGTLLINRKDKKALFNF